MSESVEVAIGVVAGKVIARWHEPTCEIAFDPKNAYSVGLHLSRAALEAYKGGKYEADMELLVEELAQVKIKVSDELRDRIIGQVATIVRSLMMTGKTHGYIAMHCVDEVLKETAR